jgi:hypothetical protein
MLSKLLSIPIVEDTQNPSKSHNQVHVQIRTLEIQKPSPGALPTKPPSNNFSHMTEAPETSQTGMKISVRVS